MVYFQKSTNVRGIHTQTHTQKHTGSGDRAIDWREVRRKNEGGRRGKREGGGLRGGGGSRPRTDSLSLLRNLASAGARNLRLKTD